jgi:hypothetical protein
MAHAVEPDDLNRLREFLVAVSRGSRSAWAPVNVCMAITTALVVRIPGGRRATVPMPQQSIAQSAAIIHAGLDGWPGFIGVHNDNLTCVKSQA